MQSPEETMHMCEMQKMALQSVEVQELDCANIACSLHMLELLCRLGFDTQRHMCMIHPVSATLQGEHKALEAFRKDPFGCQGALLSKKEDRDPFAVGPYFGNRCPDMESLLSHCESIKHRRRKASVHLPWLQSDARSWSL